MLERLRRTLGPSLAPIHGRVERLLTRHHSAHDRWKRGLNAETRFWRSYLRTELQPGAEGHFRVDPDLSFDEHPIYAPILSSLPETIEILDVGAGPLTLLPKRMTGKTIHITAVDPLADTYDTLLCETSASAAAAASASAPLASSSWAPRS